VSLCVPCLEEGREQEHHHFLDREDGRGPVPVCRWHFKGLPYPASRIAKAVPAMPAEGGEKMARKISIDLQELKALHASGLNDQDLAEKLKCDVAVIGYHRRKLKLHANGWRREKKTGIQPQRAKVANEGGKFRRATQARAVEAPTNGAGKTVQVRVEVLDAMWAGLDPEDKARLVNHLIEARERT
jgi:hypothetical protein